MIALTCDVCRLEITTDPIYTAYISKGDTHVSIRLLGMKRLHYKDHTIHLCSLTCLATHSKKLVDDYISNHLEYKEEKK